MITANRVSMNTACAVLFVNTPQLIAVRRRPLSNDEQTNAIDENDGFLWLQIDK